MLPLTGPVNIAASEPTIQVFHWLNRLLFQPLSKPTTHQSVQSIQSQLQASVQTSITAIDQANTPNVPSTDPAIIRAIV